MKYQLAAVALLVATSGCVGGSQDGGIGETSSPIDTQGSDTTTLESENWTVEISETPDTYSMIAENQVEYSETPIFSRGESVNVTASLYCGAAQQVAYNYSISNQKFLGAGLGLTPLSEYNEVRSDGSVSGSQYSEGLTDSEEQTSQDSQSSMPGLPTEVLREKNAESIEFRFLDSEGSEVASCRPTPDELNIELSDDLDMSADLGSSGGEYSEGLS
jgi:hypothetical protein